MTFQSDMTEPHCFQHHAEYLQDLLHDLCLALDRQDAKGLRTAIVCLDRGIAAWAHDQQVKENWAYLTRVHDWDGAGEPP